MGKGGNAGEPYSLLFPQCFLPFNPLPLNLTPLLTAPARKLLKTLREKEKIQVTSIFSFSQNFFHPYKIQISDHFGHICFVICKCFRFGVVQIFAFGKSLQMTNNFSFSHSVFKRLVLQTPKNQGLFANGLTLSQTSLGLYL